MAQVEDRLRASFTGWRVVETEAPGWHFARRSRYRRSTQGVDVTSAIWPAESPHVVSTRPSRYRNERRRRRGGTIQSPRLFQGTRARHTVGQPATGVLRWIRDVDVFE